MKSMNFLQHSNSTSIQVFSFNSFCISLKTNQDEESNANNNSETDWRNMDRHKKSNYGSTSYGNSGEGNDGSKKKSDRNLGGEIEDGNKSSDQNKTD